MRASDSVAVRRHCSEFTGGLPITPAPKIPRPSTPRPAVHNDRILRSCLFRPPAEDRGWQPLLDIYEVKDGWLLKADLAGVRPDEVHVTLQGRTVTLRGHRHDWAVEEG